MTASATLLYNQATPVPGLRSPRNRHFLATLGDGVVAWANAQRKQGIRPCLVVSGIDTYLGMWELAKRLGDRIDYIVENEGDDPASTLHAMPSEIGRRARLMHDACGGLGFDCMVVLGAVQGVGINGGGYRFLYDMLGGWGDYFPRAVAVNCYPTIDEIPLVAAWIHQVRGVLASRDAQSAQIWVGEWGIRNLFDEGAYTRLAEKQQAQALRDLLRQYKAAGIAESFMWASDDTNGWGFKDRAALKRVWNASVKSVLGTNQLKD